MRPPGRLVLLGQPVAHSLSPRIQNAALLAAGVPLLYESLEVSPEALPLALEELAAAGAAGNVTIPHKTAMLRYCGQVSALAERVGAVNVFRPQSDGTILGENTDVGGFEALARGVLGAPTPGLRIAVLGAGGGGAAVLAAVEGWRPASVVLYNRGMDRAHGLASRFPVVSLVEPVAERAVRDADVVVNATPIGMQTDDAPISVAALSSHAVVLDLVYRSGGTPLVRSAVDAGHLAADGLDMLVEQGALAFEFWLGIKAPRAVMRAAATA